MGNELEEELVLLNRRDTSGSPVCRNTCNWGCAGILRCCGSTVCRSGDTLRHTNSRCPKKHCNNKQKERRRIMNKKAEQQIQLKQRRTGHPGNAAPGHIHASRPCDHFGVRGRQADQCGRSHMHCAWRSIQGQTPFDCLIFGSETPRQDLLARPSLVAARWKDFVQSAELFSYCTRQVFIGCPEEEDLLTGDDV